MAATLDLVILGSGSTAFAAAIRAPSLGKTAAIFTDPQVATVGLTEAEAARAGHRCRCRTVAMAHVPRAGAVRDPRGLVKMVLDADTEKVLGVTMVGRDAGEVIYEAAMGLRLGAKVRDFADLIHVYPTMAEALKIVALAFSTDVAKLSCCAEG